MESVYIENKLPVEKASFGKILWKVLFEKNQKKPGLDYVPLKLNFDELAKKEEKDKFAWLGHSSIAANIDGNIVLVDPVFSKRVSPFSFAGPKSFFRQKKLLEIDEIKKTDFVLITHDHYDHLDKNGVIKLSKLNCTFIVPTGVEARLQKWGIEKEKIISLTHWENVKLGDFEIISTPTQHFSGRSLTDRNSTGWTSYVVISNEKKYFYSGDSGYFGGFKKIGEKFGSTDVAFIECGQYSKYWKNIHMFPEESVKVAEDINAKLVIPIHWGKYSLSLHSWFEPVERFVNEAYRKNVNYFTPEIGRIFKEDSNIKSKWWYDFKQN